MKWTENGITFEGTVAEYKELHADGFQPQLKRTRCGKHVTVSVPDGEPVDFPTVIDAAQWISQKTGRYVSATALGRVLDESGNVSLERFLPNVTLFDNTNNPKGEENHE